MESTRRVDVRAIRRWPRAVLAVTVALVAAACGRSVTPTGSVSVAQNSALRQSILVGSNGRAVYLFEKDTSGTSSCSGSCTSVWPPVITSGKPLAGSGASTSLIGSTLRSDGKTQVTYNGHPLYYYVNDKGAGQVNGEGLKQFGGLWYAVSPRGEAIRASLTPAGGGGYGGY